MTSEDQRSGAPADEPRVSSRKIPIFGIFEGGGAKGIAHVGAYAAADALNFEFVGVAGASAGSIVAALIAVGYAPREIFDPEDPQRNVFATHGLSPLDVLGAKDWQRFERLRRGWRPALAAVALLQLAALTVAMLPEDMADLFRAGPWSPAPVLAVAAIGSVAAVLAGCRALLRRRGIFDPANFAQAFNRALHARVATAYEEAGKPLDELPAQIRFRDIDVQLVGRFCRLKVVATDISGEQLRLFDHRTPDVVVAEAVAASIAIPGVFKPALIPSEGNEPGAPAGTRYFADGGLVSNLPVWCFAEEKAAAERRRPHSEAVPIVAFTLSGTAAGRAPSAVPPSPIEYVRQVLRTAVFGGQLVVQDFVADLCVIVLRCDLDVLAFDASWQDARGAHEAARQEALGRLRRRLLIEPQAWRSVLETACLEIQRVLAGALRAAGGSAPGPLRAAVFEPLRSLRQPQAASEVAAYRVTHAFNMEEDTDDRLTLDAESPGVPEAFQQRDVILWGPGEVMLPRAQMTKYERALVRRSVKTAFCIPLFADPAEWALPPGSRHHPLAVAAFDTDDDILDEVRQAEAAVLRPVAEATLGLAALMRAREADRV